MKKLISILAIAMIATSFASNAQSDTVKIDNGNIIINHGNCNPPAPAAKARTTRNSGRSRTQQQPVNITINNGLNDTESSSPGVTTITPPATVVHTDSGFWTGPGIGWLLLLLIAGGIILAAIYIARRNRPNNQSQNFQHNPNNSGYQQPQQNVQQPQQPQQQPTIIHQHGPVIHYGQNGQQQQQPQQPGVVHQHYYGNPTVNNTATTGQA